MQVWLRINSAAQYADVSPRTLRKWLKLGLKCVRLPSGTILIKASWIDDFLEDFVAESQSVKQVINELVESL